MGLYIVYGMYALTAICALSTGLACRNHSAYPNMNRGYHFAKAMTGADKWNFANKCAAKTSIYGGLFAFVLLPLVFAVIGLEMMFLIISYFIVFAIWACLVLFLPLWLLNQRFYK